MKKFLPTALLVLLVAVPAIAFAQQAGGSGYIAQGTSIFDVLASGFRLLKMLPLLAYTIATVILMYNIVKYLVAGSNPEEKQKSLKGIGFSFLGLFLMVAINGIVFLIARFTQVRVGGTIGGVEVLQINPSLINAV